MNYFYFEIIHPEYTKNSAIYTKPIKYVSLAKAKTTLSGFLTAIVEKNSHECLIDIWDKDRNIISVSYIPRTIILNSIINIIIRDFTNDVINSMNNNS